MRIIIIYLSSLLFTAGCAEKAEPAKQSKQTTTPQSSQDQIAAPQIDDDGTQTDDANFVTTSKYVDLEEFAGSDNLPSEVRGLNYQHCLLDPKGFNIVFMTEKDTAKITTPEKRFVVRLTDRSLDTLRGTKKVGEDQESYASLEMKSAGTWSTMSGGDCSVDFGNVGTKDKTNQGIAIFTVQAEVECYGLSDAKGNELAFKLGVDCDGMDFSNATNE